MTEKASSGKIDVAPGPAAAPSITVGVPVYNGEAYLDRALSSLLEQNDVDFELLVADNCSTDSTELICRRFARRDSRVRYVRRETNVGVQTNHNLLVHAARGAYFLWAAHDDESAPGRLSRLHRALSERPDAVAAISAVQEIDTTGAPLHVWRDECGTGQPDPVRRLHGFLAHNRTTLHIYGMFRRDALLRTGLIAPTHQGDRILLAELLLAGPFVEVPEPLLSHRLHGNRVSVRDDPRELARQELGRDSVRLLDLPNVDELVRYVGVLRRAPLSRTTRLRAFAAMRPWFGQNTVPMARNLGRAGIGLIQRTTRRKSRD